MARSTPPLFMMAPDPEAEGLYADSAEPGGPRGDSGVDLRFPSSILIPPSADGKAVLVDLGVRARCLVDGGFAPYHLVPRISKTPLSYANSIGVIDAGYQGRLKVGIRNFSDEPWQIHRGASLFQIVRPDLTPARVVVVGPEHAVFTVKTERGAGGFGSTGCGGAL